MKNPFYPLLVIVGVVFAVTAVAYGVMAVVELRTHGTTEHPLLTWLETYGNMALIAQLALLASLTCAAIGTDGYWERK